MPRRLTCAACTGSAMVKLLVSRTTVLKVPSLMSSSWLAAWKASGKRVAVDDVGGEQAAEEHDLLVTRNTHIPSVDASCCCSASSK